MYNRSETVNQTVYGSSEAWKLYNIAIWMYWYSPWIPMTISVLGNGAAFITLLKMRPFSSLSLIVAYLAVMDTLSVATNFAHTMLLKVSLGVLGCKILMFFVTYTAELANWTLVLMTVERFIAVTYPLKISQYFTFKKTVIYLTVMLFVLLLPSCPVFWTFTELDYGNEIVCNKIPTGLEQLLLGFAWMDFVLVSLLPCSLLIFLNSAIVRAVYKAAKQRTDIMDSLSLNRRTNRISRKQPQFPNAHLSLMLVAVSIAFIVFQLPIHIYYIFDKYRLPSQDYDEQIRRFLVATVIHRLHELNHSFNFFFYFLSGKRFRNRFLEVFYCRKLFFAIRRHKDNNTEGPVPYTSHSRETMTTEIN